jgi:hypothetical protein
MLSPDNGSMMGAHVDGRFVLLDAAKDFKSAQFPFSAF